MGNDAATVLLVGNPNVGKTTLFNLLAAQNARVGNYPGITVERREAPLRLADRVVQLVDVPGTYSLSARSTEEQVAIQATLGMAGNEPPDLVVVVVDATQLVRNLYLALQLVELRVPLLIAVNMMDEAEDNRPSPDAISGMFGVPCVGTDARSGSGIDELRAEIDRALRSPSTGTFSVKYPALVEAPLDDVSQHLPDAWRGAPPRERALALWALLSIDEDDELVGIDPGLRAAVLNHAADLKALDDAIIGARYTALDERSASLFEQAPKPATLSTSDRIDRVLLHPVFGFAAFIAIMFVVFQALFSWSDPAISAIEGGVGWLQGWVRGVVPPGFIHDLLVDGVIGGVGNVVVFLPQILLLFFFIGLLEDSGYMARVAYLMDRIMKAMGLHGRAFVPMLSGFACAVPAILATRTMERQRDRLLTMMVVPLMTCSARLPVYTLIIAALFPPSKAFGAVPVQGLLMVGMYLFATVIALLAAGVLGRTAIKGRRIPLLLELPPYRRPSLRATLRMMRERGTVFLKEAGTVILACTIALWALLAYPKFDAPPDMPPEAQAAAQLEHSYGGRMGKAIEPTIAPLGFDWKLGVGIIGAFAAREVFVSTMGLVYGLGEVDDEAAPLRERIRRETRQDGKPAYPPLVGLSLMVFFALACQCMSTVAVVKRETRGWKWPLFMVGYMTALAWFASFLVYQGGKLLGFAS